MKQLFSLLFLLISSYVGIAQQLKPVDAESEINFNINNFGLTTKGNLKGLTGTINWNSKNTNACTFLVSADATTINTNITSRDNHLKKADYFNVAKFPTITIKSTKIISVDNINLFEMEADLTLKVVTKKIKIPFTANALTKGILFNGKFEIDRKDYGVGGSSFSLSNTVKVNLNVIANIQ